jgi:carboxylesterase type B
MGIVNLLIGTGAVGSPGSAVTSAIGSVFNAAGAIMTCASRDASRSRVSAGVKAWRYRYFAEWPNQFLASGTGAYHGVDVPIVFGSAQFYTNISDVPEETALSKNMRHAWAEFARDPQSGLSKLGWPVYNEQSRFEILKFCCPRLRSFGLRCQCRADVSQTGLAKPVVSLVRRQ